MINNKKYTCEFNRNASLWENDERYNWMALKSVELKFNDLLKRRGYVFLRDIYEAFNYPITKESIYVGWLYDLGNPKAHNHIDFTVNKDVSSEEKIVLIFEVDGDISNCF